MTETATDRSKRRFVQYLLKYRWTNQFSVFYKSYNDAKLAIMHSKKIRKSMIRQYPTQAFLWRLCLRSYPSKSIEDAPRDKNSIAMPFHTFFTNKSIGFGGFENYMTALLDLDLSVKGRTVDLSKISSYSRSVRMQRPHNLKSFFGNQKINRFSLLGKAHADFAADTSDATWSPDIELDAFLDF